MIGRRVGRPRRLAGGLERVADVGERSGVEAALELVRRQGGETEGERITVLVSGSRREDEADLSRRIRGLGGEILRSEQGLMRVRVSAMALEELSEAVGDRGQVRYPTRPRTLNTTISQGVGVTEALAWHAAGITGAGVKLAVIDVGFSGLAGRIAADEIPASVVGVDFSGFGMGSGGSHGTGVAEIIYDMAPGVQLYLLNVNDDLDLLAAEVFCKENGVSVVNSSLGWYGFNFFDGVTYSSRNPSPVSIASDAAANGILWVSSAGNDQGSHARISWRDSDSDDTLDWSAGGANVNTLGFLGSGTSVNLWLTWNAWPVTDQDFDMYLVRYDATQGDWVIVAFSETWQDGTEAPVEHIGTTVTTSGTYGLVVAKYAATTNPHFIVRSWYQALNYKDYGVTTPAPGSIGSPADAASVLAVGAIRWSVYDTGGVETFSSLGPNNRAFTGGLALVKPDLCGPDGTASITFPGGFSGTSASSPHVAAMAALVKSAFPAYSATQIREFLEARAVDAGVTGKDNTFGWGRAKLGEPGGIHEAPAGTSGIVETLEDTGYRFARDDFGFSDTGDSPPDTFQAVKITDLPELGTLTSNGVPVSANAFIPVSVIDGGRFRYEPEPGASGIPYTSFLFQVQDSGGTEDGSVDLDPTARTMTLQVEPALTVLEDQTGAPHAFALEGVDSGSVVTVTGYSAAPELLASSGIAFTGEGLNRSMTLTPRPDQFGGTWVTVVASTNGGPFSDDWLATGSPGVGRHGHTLSKGGVGRLLAAGGWVNGAVSASCEVFSETTGQWTAAPAMGSARAEHRALSLADGRVLVVGGVVNALGTVTATCQIWDPSGNGGSGSWSVADSMDTPRTGHSVVRLPNGKVLAIGGTSGSGLLASCEWFDPATGLWTVAGNLAVARRDATAEVLEDGRILVSGGMTEGGVTASCELMNPLLNGGMGAWSAGPAMSRARERHTSTRLSGGRVLVIGGWAGSPMDACEIFDPLDSGGSGAWRATGSLNFPRHRHTATVLVGDHVLVVGGVGASPERWDPGLHAGVGGWFPAGSGPAGRVGHAAERMDDGERVLVLGGQSDVGETEDSSDVYDSGESQIAWTESHRVRVIPVNDRPEFVKGPDVTVPQGGGVQYLVAWATGMVPGPSNELGQALTFEIEVEKPGLFVNGPALDASGQLQFEPSAVLWGRSLVTVRLRDDGGTADGGLDVSNAQTFLITVTPPSTQVSGRHLFYNNSAWDGRNAVANTADDAAIATDKVALLRGSMATFANYSSYSRGINGIMVDLGFLPGTPEIADFEFRVGNNNTPGSWATAPSPTVVALRRGAGVDRTDRVTLIWPDQAVTKQWLEVTILPTARTGLSAPAVFYFGNAIGETGNSVSDAQVNGTDVSIIRANPRGVLNLAILADPYDINRDRLVNGTDVSFVRAHSTGVLNALRRINLTALGDVRVAEGTGVGGDTAGTFVSGDVGETETKRGLAAAGSGMFERASGSPGMTAVARDVGGKLVLVYLPPEDGWYAVEHCATLESGAWTSADWPARSGKRGEVIRWSLPESRDFTRRFYRVRAEKSDERPVSDASGGSDSRNGIQDGDER